MFFLLSYKWLYFCTAKHAACRSLYGGGRRRRGTVGSGNYREGATPSKHYLKDLILSRELVDEHTMLCSSTGKRHRSIAISCLHNQGFGLIILSTRCSLFGSARLGYDTIYTKKIIIVSSLRFFSFSSFKKSATFDRRPQSSIISIHYYLLYKETKERTLLHAGWSHSEPQHTSHKDLLSATTVERAA